jgi:ribose transport system substrate-binding protein
MTNTRRNSSVLRAVLSLFAVLLLGSLAACSGSGSGGGSKIEGTGKLEGDGKLIVAFIPSTATPYIGSWWKSTEAEAKRLGYDIKKYENKTDQTTQDQQVQQYLASPDKDLSAFIWWPSNAQAGIASSAQLSAVAPVIQTNQSVRPEGKKYITAYAGVNAHEIGVSMGTMAKQARDEWVAKGQKLHSAGGNVLEFTFPSGYQSGIDRHEGFLDGTKDKPFNVLQTEPTVTSFDAASTLTAASPVIAKYRGKIDIVVAQNLGMASGVITALEQNGYHPGKDVLVIAGNDAGDKTNLQNGKVYSAVIQSPAVEGRLAVDTVAQYLATGKVTKKTVNLEVSADAPKLAVEAPAEVTFMPDPPIQWKDTAAFRLWGLAYDQLGS